MGMLGYTKRNSFLIGLIAAQVSEFSFILLSLGITVGHLSTETLSLVTVVGLITMAGSSYFINYGEKIYLYLSLFLSIFEKKGIKIDEHTLLQQKKYDIILFGHNRLGYDILEALKKLKKNYLVIDYNPETVASLTKNNVSCVYGDASDPEFLDDLDMKKVKMIISTVPDFETNRLLISDLRCHNKKTISIVVSHQIDEALKLYELGATYVIMPHFLGGHHTSTMIQEYGLDVRKFIKEKIAHVKHLEKRKKIGHEHPVHERA
jgi:Trk K+ transport system NAD-binding subunit